MRKHHNKNATQQPIAMIQQELAQIRLRIDTLSNNFENVTDPDLIDSFIFESNAAWKRYHFLIREIRILTSA